LLIIYFNLKSILASLARIVIAIGTALIAFVAEASVQVAANRAAAALLLVARCTMLAVLI